MSQRYKDHLETKLLQVYSRRSANNHSSTLPPSNTGQVDAPSDSPSTLPSSPSPIMSPELTPPIALRKGTHSSGNPHPIYNFLSYHLPIMPSPRHYPMYLFLILLVQQRLIEDLAQDTVFSLEGIQYHGKVKTRKL